MFASTCVFIAIIQRAFVVIVARECVNPDADPIIAHIPNRAWILVIAEGKVRQELTPHKWVAEVVSAWVFVVALEGFANASPVYAGIACSARVFVVATALSG
jgi:hypothetical protein